MPPSGAVLVIWMAGFVRSGICRSGVCRSGAVPMLGVKVTLPRAPLKLTFSVSWATALVPERPCAVITTGEVVPAGSTRPTFTGSGNDDDADVLVIMRVDSRTKLILSRLPMLPVMVAAMQRSPAAAPPQGSTGD